MDKAKQEHQSKGTNKNDKCKTKRTLPILWNNRQF